MKKKQIIGICMGVVFVVATVVTIVKVIGSKKDMEQATNGPDETEEDLIASNATVITKDGALVYFSSTEEAQNQNWYKTSYPLSNTLTQGDSLDITEVDDTSVTTINIDSSTTYDPFFGIGTSIEESTVYNIMQLTKEKRKEFVYKLVDPVNGAGMTSIRLTIGTSDFTGLDFYTYYDVKTQDGEPNWYPKDGEEGFRIQKDIDNGILEIALLVKEAAEFYGVEDQLKFFSSPWSPPGWMKNETGNSLSYENNDLLLKGGELNSDYIDDLAIYYTRYVEEYAKLGIHISALTLQNEPLLEINYPSCHVTATQEAQLTIALKESLKNSAILKELGVNIPKLWAFDHNPSELLSYMSEFFGVEGAFEALDGVAVHDYSGALSEMERLKEMFFVGTDKTVHLTERSVWGTEGANQIIQYFRNGATSYNSWVTMLDSNIDHMQWVGIPSPTMFIREAGSDSNYWACPEYYIAGNFGRFIRPGYVRVESDPGSNDTVTNVVYASQEDGTMVVVVVNQTAKEQSFKLVFHNKQIHGTLPAGNVATYIWTEGASTIADPIINGNGNAVEEKDTSVRKADTSLAIRLGNESIDLKESEVFESKGTFAKNMEKGNYEDFLLEVQEAGVYQITYSVKCDADGAGVGFALQTVWGSQENPAQIGNNKKDISIPSLWGAQKIRYGVTLEEGLQTLRFKAQSGGYTISAISIEKANVISIPADGISMNATSFYDAQNSHAIENDSNIGYTVAGSVVDYAIHVEREGTYSFALNYASTAATPSMLIQAVKADGTVLELGTILVPSTGDWSTYQLSEEISVSLEAGVYTLRLTIQGDGINFKEIIIK